MRVARLGVVIDPAGAKAGAAEVNAAQQSMAATANKVATDRTNAERRTAAAAVQAQSDQVKAIQAAERAQNKAANETKRAQQAASDYAAAQRRAAEAAEAQAKAEERKAIAVQRAADNEARARALLEIQAYAMNEAFDAGAVSATRASASIGALREPLTAVASHAVGAAGSFGTLASSLSMISMGSAATVGVLLAVTAIGAAFEKATEKSRAFKKASEDATKALDELAKRKRQGPGGDLVDQVAQREKELRILAAEIAKLEAELARPKISMSNSNTGATDTRAVAEQRLKVKRAEFNDLAVTTELGTRELRKIEDRAAGEALASLVAANVATTDEQKRYLDQIANLKKQIAANLSAGGDTAERARLLADLKALESVVDAAANKAEAAAKRRETSAEKALREETKGLKESQRITAELSEGLEEYLAGLSKARVRISEINEARAKDAKVVAELNKKVKEQAEAEIAALQFQLSLTGKTRAEQEGLIDLENRRLAAAENYSGEQVTQIVNLKRQVREQQQADTERLQAQSRELERNTAIARELQRAFRDAGLELSDSVKQAGALALALLKVAAANKAVAAAKTADERKAAGAAQATAQGAASGLAVGAVIGFIASGFAKIAEANRKAEEAQERAAEKMRQFNASVIEFSRSLDQIGQGEFARARTGLTEQLDALFQPLRERFGVNLLGGAEPSSAAFRDLLNGGNGPGRVAKPTGELADALRKLAEQAERAEVALRKEQAAKIAAMREDLQVRQLMATGRTAEAEALRLQIQQQRELAEARNNFTGADGFAEFIAALEAVQKAEKEAADAARAAAEAEEALAKKRRATEFALDIQARAQTNSGDDRGAFVTRQNISYAQQLAAAEDLYKSGTITLAMLEDAKRVFGDEFTKALEEFDKAAKRAAQALQDDIAIRTLVALGKDKEAEQARREIENKKELEGITDAAIIAQIVYVQQLEAEARARQEAAELLARVQRENEDITRRMIEAYRTVDASKAEELESMQREIDRARELAAAVDDATRARLEELYLLEDEARAIRKLADEHVKAAAAAEKLANLTANVNEEYLRATGNEFEADRLALVRRRDEQLKAAQEAGATAETIAQIKAIFDANFAKLIQGTVEKSSPAVAAASARTDLETEFISRSGARSISTTEAVRLIDVAVSQLTVLRNIERNTAEGSGGGFTVNVTVQGGTYQETPANVGRGMAQAIAPFIQEEMGRRVGILRRLAGKDGL